MSRSQPPHVLVVRAPGTNCDRETAFAFESAGATTSTLHLNALLRSPRKLRDADGLAIPGGFSFGDDLGAGAVFGAMLRTTLRDPVRKLVDRGGIVLGICNGFQVLVRTGLLPGFADEEGEERLVALASNAQNRYEDRWVHLEAVASHSVFFKQGDRIHCPIAHAEGRFLPRDEQVRGALHARDLIGLKYVQPNGAPAGHFPHNPNGAVDDVAGLVDPTGRILGLMPHPERNQFVWQDPRFHAGKAPKRPEGRLPFTNAVRALRRKR